MSQRELLLKHLRSIRAKTYLTEEEHKALDAAIKMVEEDAKAKKAETP